jgi:D-alanyl-D-alanine carboxypeptidase/D-alanyl-D-alanine-endopeptidase (penicillin-binding protein 4)
VEQLLAPVVRELRAAGLREVVGELVLDEGSFLEPGPGPAWPAASQHWQEHCALAAGFTANAGCLTAVVEPRAVGATAWSELRPRAHGLQRSGSVKTVAAGARLDIAVGATATTAILRGEIPAGVGTWTSRFAHPDPIQLFEASLRVALEQGGIRLAGATRRQRGLPLGRPLAVLRSALVDLLAPINTDSNNAVADQLFFALGNARGGSGTRAGGGRAVAESLERLGVSGIGLVQVDGSGLSRDDRVAAKQLTSLLAAVLDLEPATREAFIASLPVSGTSGSLEHRMGGERTRGRVLAKTGWIEGTGALSGYVRTEAGETLCFSILVDYPKVSGLNRSCWKPMQDRICEELVGWRRAAGAVR